MYIINLMFTESDVINGCQHNYYKAITYPMLTGHTVMRTLLESTMFPQFNIYKCKEKFVILQAIGII